MFINMWIILVKGVMLEALIKARINSIDSNSISLVEKNIKY